MTIAAAELVPGDLVRIESGDRVAADLRLIDVHGTAIDESALTGESVPVDKQVAAVAEETPLAERTCMAWAGTLVTRGQATGIVVATGAQTEIGEVSTHGRRGRGDRDAAHAQARAVRAAAHGRHRDRRGDRIR